MKPTLWLVTALLLGLVGACGDPVHSDAVAALGPEAPGVPKGPNHRPGQPCLVCHGGSGPAGRQFSVGGTIDYTQRKPYPDGGAPPPRAPGSGVTVQLTDSKNSMHTTTTNGVGNFYIYLSDWAPVWPIGGVTTDGGVPDTTHAIQICTGGSPCTQTSTNLDIMYSHVGRDGSCADCHFYPPGPLTNGPIYLVAAMR